MNLGREGIGRVRLCIEQEQIEGPGIVVDHSEDTRKAHTEEIGYTLHLVLHKLSLRCWTGI